MAYNPQNPNGQATMANSAPVVIASDQSNVPVSGTVSVNALPTGTNSIGNIGTVSTVTNLSQLGGVNISMNSGVRDSGTPRVTIATNDSVPVTATSKFSIGANVVMTVTNLQSLSSSATAGWQSARVSNLVTLARDYEIFVSLNTANTAPANDRSMYVYVCPFYTTDGGTTWFASSQGTTTLPTGNQGTTTIATPNNLRLLGILNYTTQNMTVQDTFLLSNCFGDRMPDGFSIIIINFSGAALGTSCVVNYKPINDTLA